MFFLYPLASPLVTDNGGACGYKCLDMVSNDLLLALNQLMYVKIGYPWTTIAP
jgi:hypothetical protein